MSAINKHKTKKPKKTHVQRKDNRYATKLTAYVEEIDKEVPCSVKNISKGGFFIKGNKEISSDKDIQFRLVLQDSKGSQEIYINGEITFSLDEKTAKKIGTSSGVGVKVIDFPSDYDRERFCKFISHIECLGTSFALLGPKFDK